MRKLWIVVGICLTFLSCTQRQVKAPSVNVFRMPVGAKLSTLDPHNFHDAYGALVMGVTYENLYQYHYLKRPYEPIPALADGMPQASKDRKVWTIKLKQGLKFQDDPCFVGGKGRELKAADVVFSYERIASPKKLRGSYASLEGLIEGIEDFHAGKTAELAGVKALDDYTVQFRLQKPMPRFIHYLVDAHTAIVPKEAADKYGDDGLMRHTVGTGPYVIAQADLGAKIVAERNPNFREEVYPSEGMPGDAEKGLLADAGKRLPFIDKVVFEIVTEAQPAWLKFLAGEFEYGGPSKDSMANAVPNGKLSPELVARKVQLFREVKGDVTAEMFNMQDPVWGKHKELRYAVALALDFKKIIELQYAGQAIKAQSLLDPNSYGHDRNFKSKWSERNLEKAKEYLAKAGFPEGKGLPPLLLPNSAGSDARILGEMMERQLAEVGIKTQSEYMTWPEFEARTRNRKFGMLGMGFASSYPDFDDSTNVIHSRYVATGGNPSGYKNPEVDALIGQIERMDNGPQRLAKIRRVMEILDDDLPIIWGVHRIGTQLAQPWVKNFLFTDSTYHGRFMKYRRVEVSK